MTKKAEFLVEVGREIERARKNFPGQEEELSWAEWCAILTEEVGECARHVNEIGASMNPDTFTVADLDGHTKRLQTELVQVAAMAFRWYAGTWKL